MIAALPTRRGRSGKNPRTMIDGPRPPPRGHPSPGSACRRPFLALAANVNPAAPPPCREPGVLRAYASIERDGWRARIERPPAGVCVEDARAILCRGGRGQTVAECSPPAIRSSSSGGRRAGPAESSQNAKTSCFVLDRMTSHHTNTRIAFTRLYLHMGSITHRFCGDDWSSVLLSCTWHCSLSAHDGRCSRHPRLPDLRPARRPARSAPARLPRAPRARFPSAPPPRNARYDASIAQLSRGGDVLDAHRRPPRARRSSSVVSDPRPTSSPSRTQVEATTSRREIAFKAFAALTAASAVRPAPALALFGFGGDPIAKYTEQTTAVIDR